MDVTHSPQDVTALDLVRVGAKLDFAAQRFAYLRQHPDGRPGQPFVFDNAVAFSMTLMLGMLLDLILDVCDGHLPYGKTFDADLTPDGMDVTIQIRRVPDEARPGYKLIKSLASSIAVNHDKRNLVIRMSGASIDSGFPQQDQSVCPPVIVVGPDRSKSRTEVGND
jgi:hypothetical protein